MAWRELAERVEAELRQASAGEQVVFCAAVAERLMAGHLALPAAQQRPFTLAQRPLLEALWDAACGDRAAFARIKDALGAYYLSEYCHNDSHDGPDDADDAAAAVLFGAECYLHGLAGFAALVSQRGCDAADLRAQNTAGDVDDAGLACGTAASASLFADSDPQILAELEHQLADLRLIRPFAADLDGARWGLAPDATARLYRDLRAPLSRAVVEPGVTV